ncbi:hypothetical protein CSB09_02735 [Candidatus Gracilibacteria bacterium]|nr:MAG: hypothetical protein CSB09_02735 [Candidatus Gracilibacteria bacterium]
MQITSHFLGIELEAQYFCDLFVEVFAYVKKHSIESAVSFQNPLSPHITLYYLKKDESDADIQEIKEYIATFDLHSPLYVSGLNYFLRPESKTYILYFTIQTDIPLQEYRERLHHRYQRNQVEDNTYPFSAHMTFLRIRDSGIFEAHRENIEKIIHRKLQSLGTVDVNTGRMYVYAVNSHFKEEIQIKL